MPFNYDLLRQYARGVGQEQREDPAADLAFYEMVSIACYMCSLLMVGKLRDISLEQDRVAGDVVRWQYGAVEALSYVCVLHGGNEGVARVVVAARYVLSLSCGCGIGMLRVTHGGRVVAAVLSGEEGCRWRSWTSCWRMPRRGHGERFEPPPSPPPTTTTTAGAGCAAVGAASVIEVLLWIV